jgi:hypothetical protein
VTVGWLIAAAGAGLLVAGRTRPGLLIAVGWAAWAGLTGGLARIDVFHHSSSPFAWSMPTARALTAVELGVAAAVLVVAIRALTASRTATASLAAEPLSPGAVRPEEPTRAHP